MYLHVAWVECMLWISVLLASQIILACQGGGLVIYTNGLDLGEAPPGPIKLHHYLGASCSPSHNYSLSEGIVRAVLDMCSEFLTLVLLLMVILTTLS